MIVKAHGGTISVKENVDGIGSEFWFEVPTSEISTAESVPEQRLFLD